MVLGILFRVYIFNKDLVEFKDIVGFNNLCYIRAPYQILRFSALRFCFRYLSNIEQG